MSVPAQEIVQGLTRATAFSRADALADLGRKIFFDVSLSASGKLACASCHDPMFAYGPNNSRPVQRGGKDGKQWGTRAVPSLMYLQAVPQFTEHYFDADLTGDDSVDNGPTGGLTWDGRVDRGRDQARIPLLSANEMANDSPAAVVGKVRRASYAAEFERLSGKAADPGSAFVTILEALEAWEQNERQFYPYSSKYDAFLGGRTPLSASEQRGLKLFTDSNKGDCSRCHIATRGVNGTPPQFTDYGLIALGVPRNMTIPANANRGWFDLGMCGPERNDLGARAEYCGRFMTPTLRNVATRKVFFHNGVFHSLKEVIEFYTQRDTHAKLDDLPAQYRGNIETGSPPGRKLTDGEIRDIIAFLQTLTDGFRSANLERGESHWLKFTLPKVKAWRARSGASNEKS